MPIACITIPHFALRVTALERPELDGAPLVLGPPPGARPLVTDVSPEAAARGIRPGLGLREVAALCPAAVVLPPHPSAEAATSQRVTEELLSLTPLVEVDQERPGCWYVDLAGSERLLGPPSLAAAHLLGRVPPLLRPRAGVASGKFAARVAATTTAAGVVYLIASAETAPFLAQAPITTLPVRPELVRRLERLSLRTLGDLAALPPAAVAARFGAEGRRLWELARGIDQDPVRPLPPAARVVETLELPDLATSRETLLVGLARLAGAAFARPALHDRHVRQARLQARLEGGGSWEQVATLRLPGGKQTVITALGYRLADLVLPGPVERLTLELLGIVAVAGRQELLPGFRSRRPRDLVEAARHLKQRYGNSGLYTVMEVEPWSRIPERRLALIAYDL